MHQKLSLEKARLESLPTILTKDYKDIEVIQQSNYHYSLNARSQKDQNEFTIKILDVQSEFYQKKDADKAKTLFLNEMLYYQKRFDTIIQGGIYTDGRKIAYVAKRDHLFFNGSNLHCSSQLDGLLKTVLEDSLFLIDQMGFPPFKLNSDSIICSNNRFMICDWSQPEVNKLDKNDLFDQFGDFAYALLRQYGIDMKVLQDLKGLRTAKDSVLYHTKLEEILEELKFPPYSKQILCCILQLGSKGPKSIHELYNSTIGILGESKQVKHCIVTPKDNQLNSQKKYNNDVSAKKLKIIENPVMNSNLEIARDQKVKIEPSNPLIKNNELLKANNFAKGKESHIEKKEYFMKKSVIQEIRFRKSTLPKESNLKKTQILSSLKSGSEIPKCSWIAYENLEFGCFDPSKGGLRFYQGPEHPHEPNNGKMLPFISLSN